MTKNSILLWRRAEEEIRKVESVDLPPAMEGSGSKSENLSKTTLLSPEGHHNRG